MNLKSISIDIDGTSVKIETGLDVTAETLSQAAVNAVNELKSKSGNVSNVIEIPKQKTSNIVPINTKTDSEREPFRDRIPNEIDISDLKITKAKTKKTLMRCPTCGQGHCGVVMDGEALFFMRRKKGSDVFDTVMQCDGGKEEFLMTVSRKEDESKEDYYNSMQNTDVIDDTDFVADKDTEVFCPVCYKSSKLMTWMDAYDHPEKYFEYAYVCDVCGGEMDSVPTPEGRVVMVCEDCGHKEALTD